MPYESLILILIALACAYRFRIFRSQKNAIFYAACKYKGALPTEFNSRLQKYYTNIHRISSPANYLEQTIIFCLILAVWRAGNPDWTLSLLFQIDFWFLDFGVYYPPTLFKQILSAALISVGTNLMSNDRWQVWINRGSGLPDYDPDEERKAEQFFWNKLVVQKNLFVGRNKRWYYLVGGLMVIVGLLMIVI